MARQQALRNHIMALQVRPVLVLELVDKVNHHPVVEVLAFDMSDHIEQEQVGYGLVGNDLISVDGPNQLLAIGEVLEQLLDLGLRHLPVVDGMPMMLNLPRL